MYYYEEICRAHSFDQYSMTYSWSPSGNFRFAFEFSHICSQVKRWA